MLNTRLCPQVSNNQPLQPTTRSEDKHTRGQGACKAPCGEPASQSDSARTQLCPGDRHKVTMRTGDTARPGPAHRSPRHGNTHSREQCHMVTTPLASGASVSHTHHAATTPTCCCPAPARPQTVAEQTKADGIGRDTTGHVHVPPRSGRGSAGLRPWLRAHCPLFWTRRCLRWTIRLGCPVDWKHA